MALPQHRSKHALPHNCPGGQSLRSQLWSASCASGFGKLSSTALLRPTWGCVVARTMSWPKFDPDRRHLLAFPGRLRGDGGPSGPWLRPPSPGCTGSWDGALLGHERESGVAMRCGGVCCTWRLIALADVAPACARAERLAAHRLGTLRVWRQHRAPPGSPGRALRAQCAWLSCARAPSGSLVAVAASDISEGQRWHLPVLGGGMMCVSWRSAAGPPLSLSLSESVLPFDVGAVGVGRSRAAPPCDS